MREWHILPYVYTQLRTKSNYTDIFCIFANDSCQLLYKYLLLPQRAICLLIPERDYSKHTLDELSRDFEKR